MGVRGDNKCIYCPSEIDYIEHFFYDCAFVKQFWKWMEGKILQSNYVLVKLSVIDILFGMQHYGNFDTRTVRHVDFMILVGKMCISIKKKTDSPTPLHIIFEQQLLYRKLSD